MGMFGRFVKQINREAVLSALVSAPFWFWSLTYEYSAEFVRHVAFSKIETYGENWISANGASMIAAIISYIPSTIVWLITGTLVYLFIAFIVEPLWRAAGPVKSNSTLNSIAPPSRQHADAPKTQKDGDNRPPAANGTNILEPSLPPNAKFRFRGEIYWAAQRRYTPEEAQDMRALVRELFDCVIGGSEKVMANYDGMLPEFVRHWGSIFVAEGPEPTAKRLDAARAEIVRVYQSMQDILNRKPYFGDDLRALIADSGATGQISGAIDDLTAALRTLPEEPNSELVKRYIVPLVKKLDGQVDVYGNWRNRFSFTVRQLRPELEKLSDRG